ncbi:MAG TPA: Holliday junction branch migration protein RuvA [Candidatus Dormibacteraeota bacterium]|nr:Holliday junction branch migration protein RuvA [Candidatus Dormibacteraeota bacterium]
MIRYLRGRVLRLSQDEIVIDVGGIGYLVQVPLTAREGLRQGEEAELHVHTHVREDQLALFGFNSLEALRMFEMLIQVDGVGPKVGLAILGSASLDVLQRAILSDEVGPIRRAPGVGPRTAQKVIIDLKPRLEAERALVAAAATVGDGAGAVNGELEGQVEQALRGLGFSTPQAKQGLAAIDWSAEPAAQDALRVALRALGRDR